MGARCRDLARPVAYTLMGVKAVWRGVMRRHVTLALTLMLGAGGAGCEPPPVRGSSTRFIEHAPQIERLLLIADIKSPVFGDVMYDGFRGSIMAALSWCHVEGRLEHKDPMGLDEEDRLLRSLKEFQPDAQLLIDATGGTLQGDARSTLRGVQVLKRLFEVDLFVGAAREVAWHASVVMQDSHGDPAANGAELAVHVISRLRADGLLQGCPAGKVSSAVCRAFPRAAAICH